MAEIFEYEVGDRVALALDGAFEAEQRTGRLGTVEKITYRYGKNPLYHVVLDNPIVNPSMFFSNISKDGLRDGFDPRWLEPAPTEDGEIEIGSLTDFYDEI